jgi:hypothetical protein
MYRVIDSASQKQALNVAPILKQSNSVIHKLFQLLSLFEMHVVDAMCIQILKKNSEVCRLVGWCVVPIVGVTCNKLV